MESQDYEHYRNLTLMFFLEKLVDKGGNLYREMTEIKHKREISCKKIR